MAQSNPELLHLTTEELVDEILARSTDAVIAHRNHQMKQRNAGFNIARVGDQGNQLWMLKRLEFMILHEEVFHQTDEEDDD